MNIEFSSNRLALAGRSLSEATRMFGVPIARKYIQRLAILRAVGTFTELSGHRALRLHQLSGNRSGQHAITLTANYRLIIERIDEDTVRVIGVEDYHGN